MGRGGEAWREQRFSALPRTSKVEVLAISALRGELRTISDGDDGLLTGTGGFAALHHRLISGTPPASYQLSLPFRKVYDLLQAT